MGPNNRLAHHSLALASPLGTLDPPLVPMNCYRAL